MSKSCKSCGAPMEDNAVSCPYCGARDESAIKVTPAAEVIAKKQFCTQCGNELIPGKAFCAACGASTDRTKAAQTSAPPPAMANYRQPTAAQPNYVNRTMPAYAAAQTQSVPKKKGHGCLIAFICFLLAIALLITGFVYPGFLVDDEEGGGYLDKWKGAPGDNGTYVSSGKVSGKTAAAPKPLTITDCSVDIPEGAIDGVVTVTQKGSGVSITVDGKEDGHAVLKEKATVRLTLDKPVADESLDKIFVYYVDEDGEPVYYRPSRSQLEKGVIEFSTVHFSFWDSIEVTDQKEAEILAKELAQKEFATEMTAKDPDNALIGFFNTFYESLGITDDTVKGKLVRDAVGRISDHIGDMDKNEVARSEAAQKLYEKKLDRISDFLTLVDVANKTADGDVGGLMGVMETLLAEQVCDNFEVLKQLEIKGVAGAVAGAVPSAIFTAAETGDWSDAAIDVVKAGVTKACPVVGYVQTAAGVCEYIKDQWYDGEKEDWYRDWSRKVISDGKGGYVIDPQYAMGGDLIYNACETEFDIRYKDLYYGVLKKGSKDYTREEFEYDITEGKLKNILIAAKTNLYREFARRKKYEDEVNERIDKYRDMILAFKEFDSVTEGSPKLTVREKNAYFNKNVSMYDRLNKLVAIRTELVIFLGGEEKAMKLFRVKNSHDLTIELSNYIQSWLFIQDGNSDKNAGREYVYDLLRSLYGDKIEPLVTTKAKDNEKPKETTAATKKPKETTTTAKPKEAKYAWVRVKTDTKKNEDEPMHETYSLSFGAGWAEDLYTLSSTSQTRHNGYGMDKSSTYCDYSLTNTEPPDTIYADQVVEIDVTVTAKCSSEYAAALCEAWASWEPIEYKGEYVGWGGTLGGSDFKRKDDDSRRKAYAYADGKTSDSDSTTLTCKIGAGSEGCVKYAICFAGPSGGVRWIYEWKQVG